ncbi:MAG: hypothetical protein AAB393_10020, partial [Bacteroidota bacterium]
MKTNSPHRLFLRLFLAVLATLSLSLSPTFAQISTKVVSISPTSAVGRTPLTIRVTLQQGETIERVFLVYRAFGSSDYNRLEMDIVGNTATATIQPKDVLPPFVEYYV